MLRHITPIVAVLFLTFFNCKITNGQSCATSFFVKTLVHQGTGVNHFFLPYRNNSFITGGIANNKLGVVRLTKNIDTIWTKLYSPQPNISPNGSNQKNGALISQNDELDLCFNGNYFSKLDSLGNVLLCKKIFIPQQPSIDFSFINWKKSPDGDYVVLLTGGGYTGHGFFLFKITNDFTTLKWTKFIDSYPYSLNFSDLVVDEKNIVIAGNTHEPYSLLFKFKTTSGQFIDQKSYSLNNQGIYFDKIYKYNKGYLLKANYYMGSVDKYLITRLDTNFNPIIAYKFVTSFTTSYNLDISAQNDGCYNALYAGSVVDGHCFIDSMDNIIWNKGNQSLMYGKQISNLYTSSNKQYVVGSSTYYPNGGNVSEFRWSITTKDINGGLPLSSSAYCFNNNRSLSLNNQQLIVAPSPQFDILDTTLSLMNYNMSFEPFGGIIDNGCSSTITCNSLKIIGNTTICGSNSFILTGRRNIGCSLPIKWEILQAPLSSNLVINDSSARFQSSISGTYKIVAKITSDCLISDTISIQVVQPTPLYIGNDTTICYNDTITIVPTNVYSSYLWSNGLTTPTIVVKDSGTYWLKVTDFCNNVKSDTVTISYFPHSSLLNIKNIVKCAIDTAVLNYNSGFTNISWIPLPSATIFNNSVHIINNINQNIIFTSKDIHNCTLKDTIISTVNPSPALNLGNDKTICENDSLILIATSGMQQYIWNTGETSQQIIVKQSGQYIIKIIALNGCITSDTILVTMSSIPKFNLGRDTSICEGTSIAINAPILANLTYSWSNGSHNSSIIGSAVGKYYVTVKNEHNCITSDTLNILELFKNPSNFLPKDTSICPGYVIYLTTIKKFSNYLWNDGSTNNFREVTIPDVYKLKVTDENNCIGYDSIAISLKQYCPQAIYFPNAFTPNKDGLNDTFKPKYWGELKKYCLRIFNRWGELIFESYNPDIGWNGNQKNILNDSGVFVWVCNYQFLNSQEKIQKGTFMLIK